MTEKPHTHFQSVHGQYDKKICLSLLKAKYLSPIFPPSLSSQWKKKLKAGFIREREFPNLSLILGYKSGEKKSRVNYVCLNKTIMKENLLCA